MIHGFSPKNSRSLTSPHYLRHASLHSAKDPPPCGGYTDYNKNNTYNHQQKDKLENQQWNCPKTKPNDDEFKIEFLDFNWKSNSQALQIPQQSITITNKVQKEGD